MNITSAAVPPDTDEFELANIAKGDSQVVIPININGDRWATS